MPSLVYKTSVVTLSFVFFFGVFFFSLRVSGPACVYGFVGVFSWVLLQ